MKTYCLQQYWKHLSTNLCLQFCLTWFFPMRPHTHSLFLFLARLSLFVFSAPTHTNLGQKAQHLNTVSLFEFTALKIPNEYFNWNMKTEYQHSYILCECVCVCMYTVRRTFDFLFIHNLTWWPECYLFETSMHNGCTEISRQQKIRRRRGSSRRNERGKKSSYRKWNENIHRFMNY